MDLSTLEMTKSFCSKTRLFNEQEQSRVPDAQRATCTYFHVREKEKQLSLRGWLNYELVGISTPGKQLLPLRAGFSCNFFTTCFMICFHCLMLVQQALNVLLSILVSKYQQQLAMFTCCINPLFFKGPGELCFYKPITPHQNHQDCQRTHSA